MTTSSDQIAGAVKIRVSGPTKAVTVLMTALESVLTGRMLPASELFSQIGVTFSGYTDRPVPSPRNLSLTTTTWEATVKAAPVTRSEGGSDD